MVMPVSPVTCLTSHRAVYPEEMEEKMMSGSSFFLCIYMDRYTQVSVITRSSERQITEEFLFRHRKEIGPLPISRILDGPWRRV